jgi:hypothetical protein
MSFNGECSDRLIFVVPSRAIGCGPWHLSKFGQRPTVGRCVRLISSPFAKKSGGQACILRFVADPEICESLPNKIVGISAATNQTADKGSDERFIASSDWNGYGIFLSTQRKIDAASGLSVIPASTNAFNQDNSVAISRLAALRIINKSFRDSGRRVTRSEATMMKWPKHLLVLDHLRGPRRAGTAALALAVNSKEAIVTNKMQSRRCYSLTSRRR